MKRKEGIPVHRLLSSVEISKNIHKKQGVEDQTGNMLYMLSFSVIFPSTTVRVGSESNRLIVHLNMTERFNQHQIEQIREL